MLVASWSMTMSWFHDPKGNNTKQRLLRQTRKEKEKRNCTDMQRVNNYDQKTKKLVQCRRTIHALKAKKQMRKHAKQSLWLKAYNNGKEMLHESFSDLVIVAFITQRMPFFMGQYCIAD
ncbi:unnamed protein product [Sphenostylis stenocarpa]|uniref:Uncharacterized protein n=1 Tax=Sphenostylis stenocarpa TaxID=92480 RepID=A0AA86VTQ1_9FABA|nr:unnamed protein product [Sphenostylis stenocarpa]